VILPDACLALDYMLDMFTSIMRGLTVYPERMIENMESSYGLPFSQRVLLALIDKGMKRQEAYKIVQRTAMVSWKERRPFRATLDGDADVTGRLSGPELDGLFDYAYYTKHVDDSFRRLGLL
jgi:adenylosuccinate lyase